MNQQLVELVRQATGLLIEANRWNELQPILNEMMERVAVPTIDQLLVRLAGLNFLHPAWQLLIQKIAIGETYFFRNRDQFKVLKEMVLPELIMKRRATGYRFLRLWSAGCATGEEPYSLAILLRELLPDIQEWTISILGTDLNLANLEFARRGVYRPHSFRLETRPDVQERWFSAKAIGYEIHPSIRNMVYFQPLNLVADTFPSVETGTLNYDIILCRNVTIYFEAAVTRRIATCFYRALNDNGWLVIGHAEPASATYQEFVPRNFENAVFYQKPINGLPLPAEMPPPRPAILSQPIVEVTPKIAAAPVQLTTQPASAPVEEAPLRRARAAADREDWDTALKYLALAEREDKTSPEVHYLRALVFMHTNDLNGALQSLQRTIYCQPSFALAHYSLGELYEKQGDYRKAARHWNLSQQIVADLKPDDHLPFADELTVDMFHSLVSYRLGLLPNKGEANVNL